MVVPDQTAVWLFGGVLVVLGLATGAVHLLRRQGDIGLNRAVIEQFNLRLRTWWLLLAVLAAAFLFPRWVTVVLFGGLSFWALREFITLTPTRPADHRALFWVFVVITPAQYVCVGLDIYGLYSVLIPVYGFLFIPARVAVAGDAKRYLERCAKIQAGLMICVYCLSHAPAVLSLRLSNYPPEKNPMLLFFLVLLIAMGDVFLYAAEKLIGQRPIAPAISATKTWEGALGGLVCATLFGTALCTILGLADATPFAPLQAACMSAIVTTMAYAGGLTMSAIKRDRGVKDYGTLIEGHSGVLDRIDSLCFAAPIFFHFTRYFFR